jgi:hypothetical protein
VFESDPSETVPNAFQLSVPPDPAVLVVAETTVTSLLPVASRRETRIVAKLESLAVSPAAGSTKTSVIVTSSGAVNTTRSEVAVVGSNVGGLLEPSDLVRETVHLERRCALPVEEIGVQAAARPIGGQDDVEHVGDPRDQHVHHGLVGRPRGDVVAAVRVDGVRERRGVHPVQERGVARLLPDVHEPRIGGCLRVEAFLASGR